MAKKQKLMDERQTVSYIVQLSRYQRFLDLSGLTINTRIMKLLVATCPYLVDVTFRDARLTRRRLKPLARLGYLEHVRIRGVCHMDHTAWNVVRQQLPDMRSHPERRTVALG